MKGVCLIFIVAIVFSCTNVRTKKQETVSGVLDAGQKLLKVKASEKSMLGVKDYLSYVMEGDNGLMVDKQIGSFSYSAFYKPCEFVALANLKDISGMSRDVFDAEMKEVKDLQYFTFKIAVNDFHEEILKYNLVSEKQYEDRVNYFAFQMQQDLKLIEGKDTLRCILYHFERNYGIAPNATFVLGFEKSTADTNYIYNKTLAFEDRVFGAGKINLTIDKEKLNSIPGLNIN